MKARIFRRPSPAFVLAFIAVIASLAGTAIALPGKNKVDSNDVKKNAITGKAVKNDSLTGADINESTLNLSSGGNGSNGAEGPTGPAGAKGATGATGPAGPSTGAAGGGLAGSYPNPTIAANAVGSAQVVDNSLTATDLAPNSVGASEITNDTVGGDDLIDLHEHLSAATTVTAGTANNGIFNASTATATCGTGEDLIAWSVDWPTANTTGGGEQVEIKSVSPNFTTNAVTVIGGTDEATAEDFQVSAWCLFAT